MQFVIVLVAMFIFMYFLLIRPQRAQKQRLQEMLSRLAPGDEVITIGGMYGDVIEVHEDKVVLESAEDVLIEVTRRSIANIVPPGTEDVAEDEDVQEEDGEAGEATETETESEADTEAEVEERAG